MSGDLKNPSKSIPLGTLVATFGGLIVYVFIIFKLFNSASPEDLMNKQLVMSDIAVFVYGPSPQLIIRKITNKVTTPEERNNNDFDLI